MIEDEIRIAEGLIAKGEITEARLLLKSYLESIRQEKNDTIKILFFSVIARIEHAAENFSMAYEYSLEGFYLAKQTNAITQTLICLQLLASISFITGLREEAADYFQESIRFAKANNKIDRAALSLHYLAEVYLTMEDFVKAIHFSKESYRFYSDLHDNNGLNLCRVRLATIYIEMGDITNAVLYIDQIDTTLVAPLSHIEGTIQLLNGKISEKEQNYQTAVGNYNNALNIYSAIGNGRLIINALIHLAKLFALSGNHDHCLQTIVAALEKAEGINDSYGILLSYETLSESYRATGDFIKAYEYLEKHRVLEKKINSEEAEKKLQLLQIKYEVDKKEQEAKLYKLKSEQLERELSTKTIYLVKQTELLAKFRDDLRAVVRDSTSAEEVVRGVKTKLKELPCSSIDWEQYDEQFRAVHPKFRDNLTERFNELTPMEIKICSLLRLNLTSIDIARLLCLSDRNIENHRYRIRKKLGLNTEESIHEFLAKF